jgi:hypothetical protein
MSGTSGGIRRRPAVLKVPLVDQPHERRNHPARPTSAIYKLAERTLSFTPSDFQRLPTTSSTPPHIQIFELTMRFSNFVLAAAAAQTAMVLASVTSPDIKRDESQVNGWSHGFARLGRHS